MNHYAQKRDASHTQLVNDIRSQGVEVIEIMKPLDILCRLKRTGFIGFIEIKPTGRRTYTTKQLRFIAETTVPVSFAQDAAEAMRFLKTQVGLSQLEKNRLAAFCATATKDKYNGEMIARVLKGQI